MSNEKDSKAIHELIGEWCGEGTMWIFRQKVVEYITTARKEARAEAFKEAIAEMCPDCMEDDPPLYDEKARHEVGCSASKLRMLEAAATTQKGKNDATVKS